MILKKLLSNKTISSIQSCLKIYLQYLLNHSYIERNPFNLAFTAKHKTVQKKKEYKLRTKEKYLQYMKV